MAFSITLNAETFEFYNRSKDEIRLDPETRWGCWGSI